MSSKNVDEAHSQELAFLSAALVARRDDLARNSIEVLRGLGVSREAVREMILQSYLHDGYATALEGMVMLSEMWPGEPAPETDPSSEELDVWRERGERLFREIYGDVAERVRNNIRSVSPELAEWMVVEGYGKVLSRGVLDTPTRELGTISVLVLKRRPNQLFSHLRGARRTGVTHDQIETLLHRIDQELHLPEAVAEARTLLADLE